MDNRGGSNQLLLQLMFRELVAARILFKDGYPGQAAYHLAMSWYAHGCREAEERGEPWPDLEGFTVDTEGLPNRRRLETRAAAWHESLEHVFAFAGQGALQQQAALLQDSPGEQRALRAHVRFQLQAAEEVHRRLYWANQTSRGRGLLTRARRQLVRIRTLVLLVLLGGVAAGIWWVPMAPPAPKEQPAGAATSWAPDPEIKVFKIEDLGQVKASFSDWGDKGNHPFPGRVYIRLGGVSHARGGDISVDSNDTYVLEFLREGKKVGTVTLPLNPAVFGLQRRVFVIPEPAAVAGYDHLHLWTKEGDTIIVLGHLKLLDKAPANTRTIRDVRILNQPPAGGSGAGP